MDAPYSIYVQDHGVRDYPYHSSPGPSGSHLICPITFLFSEKIILAPSGI